jgi:glycosyl transferase, family 25
MTLSPSNFVINLESRTDRRTAMQRELLRIGWNANFFPAIRPLSPGGFTSPGARGCFLSHLEVLKKARDARANYLVILEDDVNFVRDFADKWKFAITELDSLDWSVFYPGHALLGDLPAGLSLISPTRNVLCAHFMMLNGRALPTIIEGLEQILSRPAGHRLGGPMHVDGAYSTVRAQNPTLKTYAIAPVLGYQRPSRTDIRDTRWFDRTSSLEPVIKLFRRLKAKRIR